MGRNSGTYFVVTLTEADIRAGGKTIMVQNRVIRHHRTIPPEQFGKDHWSLLAYLECVCVDQKGKIEKARMRCCQEKHPAYSGDNGYAPNRPQWEETFGTRLAGFFESRGKKKKALQLPFHDDWDCLRDLIAAGFFRPLRVNGNGLVVNVRVKMTELGISVAHQLRVFKTKGGQFAEFRMPKLGIFAG